MAHMLTICAPSSPDFTNIPPMHAHKQRIQCNASAATYPQLTSTSAVTATLASGGLCAWP